MSGLARFAPKSQMENAAQACLAACAILLAAGMPLTSTTGLVGSPGAISCDVIERQGTNVIELNGVAIADQPVSGSYTFSVETVGAGGSSINLQQGLFALEAGVERILATVMVSRSESDRHTARLTLRTAHGEEIACGGHSA